MLRNLSFLALAAAVSACAGAPPRGYATVSQAAPVPPAGYGIAAPAARPEFQGQWYTTPDGCSYSRAQVPGYAPTWHLIHNPHHIGQPNAHSGCAPRL